MKEWYAAIILAAGESKRFGKNKLLTSIKGRTLIEHSLNPFLLHQNKVKKIFVILGSQKNNFMSILEKYPIEPVENSQYTNYGMSLSIKLGIKRLIENDLENLVGIFIHPGDIPLINLDILSKYFDYPKNKENLILIPVFKNRRGHPIFLGKNLLNEVENISDKNQGLRGLLKKLNDRIVYLEINSDKILIDIDNVEDFNKLEKSS